MIWLDLALAPGRRARCTSSPGSVAVSSSVSSRASGVRSSCETAAVKPDAQLLVGGEVALPREVDEPLAAAVHVVRDDERDRPRARRRGASAGCARPRGCPRSPAARAGSRARTRSSSSRTTTASRLSSTSARPRVASASMLTRSNRRLAHRFRGRSPNSELTCRSMPSTPDGRREHEAQRASSWPQSRRQRSRSRRSPLAAAINGTTGDDVLSGTTQRRRDPRLRRQRPRLRAGGRRRRPRRLGQRRRPCGRRQRPRVRRPRATTASRAATATTGSTAARTRTSVIGGDGADRASATRATTSSPANDGNDSLFGGWGADRVYGGTGDDVLHALAADGDPDLLDCGPGDDAGVRAPLGAADDAPSSAASGSTSWSSSRPTRRRARTRTRTTRRTASSPDEGAGRHLGSFTTRTPVR